MRSRIIAVGLIVAIFALTGTVAAAATPKDDAVALVKKAVAYAKANGPDKAVAAFNDPAGSFRKGELYVFVLDAQGVTVAHVNPKMVGKNLINMKDSDGKEFQRAFIEQSAKGPGWVDYKFSNPTTKQVEAKTSYVERAGDLTIGCGIYK
jgi:cytochrome c